MKSLKTNFFSFALFLLVSLVLSCQKDKSEAIAIDNEVAFAINISSLKGASQLKSAEEYNLADADKILLTIQNSDGSPTKYTSEEVKVQEMNGVYYTKKIVLKTGDYQLTEFVITDNNDSTIFATPLAGSQLAQNVSNPLPVAFSVTKDATVYVDVEVLSTEKKTPEDFGLSSFPIIEVKIFDFMIGVADNESDELLNAKLTVSNGSWSYAQDLNSVVNNIITVKDGLSNYTLEIEMNGYITYNHTFPADSLKMHKDTIGNLPLLIELERITVTDYDGNVYKTVVIGNQIWMAENLRTTHYADGTLIPDGSGAGDIGLDYSLKYYFVYNNDPVNLAIYGRLYTWAATMRDAASSSSNPSGVQGISPVGWHIPSDAEWTQLTDYLGGISIAGGKMKETGTTHWNIPNAAATNESGFTGLPGGYRSYDGTSVFMGQHAYFWSSTVNTYAFSRGLVWSTGGVSPGETPQSTGFSVRCIKD